MNPGSPSDIEKRMNEIDVAKAREDQRVCTAVDEILVELIRAEKFHQVWPVDLDRQVMIMLEQAGKCAQHVNNAHVGRAVSHEPLRYFLAATATACIRTLVNLDAAQ